MADKDPDNFGTFRPTRDHKDPSPSGRMGQAARPTPQASPNLRQEPRWSEPKPSAIQPVPSPQSPSGGTPDAGAKSAASRPPTAAKIDADFSAPFVEPPRLRDGVAAPPRRAEPATSAADETPLPRIARTGPVRPNSAAPASGRAVPPPPHHPARFDDRDLPPAPSPRGGASTATYQDHDDDDDDAAPRRNWLKIIGLTTLAAAAGVAAAAVALLVYTPAGLVRDRLIREVKAKTGRDLVIGGKPVISFYPNVAVSLADVTLSNPPGMAGPPLIQMQRLDATIQLWPLLQRRVQVDQLVLQAPRIALHVDAQGHRNWDFAEALPVQYRRVQYAQAGATDLDQLPEELRVFARGSGQASRAATASADGISLGRIRIIDGTVQLTDQSAGIADEVTRINMTLDAPDLAGPLQASGALVWHGEAVRIDTRVTPAVSLVTGATAQTSAAIGSNLLQLTYAGAVTMPRGMPPRLAGQLTAKAPSLAKTAAWLGRPLAGEAAAGPFQFKGRVAFAGTKAGFTDALLQAPGVNMTGALDVDTSGARPKLTGAVRLAEFNPDLLVQMRWSETNSRSTAKTVPAIAPLRGSPNAPQTIEELLKQSPPVQSQVRGFTARDGWGENPLDLTALAFADADVKIAFNRLAVSNLQVGPGQLTVHLADRALKVTVDDMSLHEGKVRGTVVLDATAARVATSINLALDGVAMLPLLKDLGADGLDGKAKLTLAVTGAGRTERQIVDSFAGKAEVLIPRGALIGYDLSAMVRGVMQGRLPNSDRDPAARTEFTDFGAAFVIAKGIADNRDFRVVTRDVRAIGGGQIALGPRTLDFTVRPKLLAGGQAPAGAGGPGLNLSALDIPVRISGPLAKPQIAADFGNVLKDPAAVVDAVKQLNTDEVQDTVKGLLKGDEASKTKAKDFLNNLLKR
jgi:AsmA protein